MEVKRIEVGGAVVGEVGGEGVVVARAGDAIELFLNAGVQAVILRERQLAPEFFHLATGLAGEIAQKCVNYGLRLAIVGNFEGYDSRSLRAFMVESNRTGRVVFARSLEEALQRLAGGRV